MTDVTLPATEPKQARPHEELIRELLDPSRPKTEREHAAVREIERLREAVGVDAHKATLASLVAAVSLLRRGGGSAAPSDVMFNMMLADYEKSIEASRDALTHQPTAVADATVARLTKDQRTRLVEKLVADQVEGADRLSSYLWSVLKNGFKGYNNYTDQELLDAHWDAFDEDFFGLESGDDQ